MVPARARVQALLWPRAFPAAGPVGEQQAQVCLGSSGTMCLFSLGVGLCCLIGLPVSGVDLVQAMPEDRRHVGRVLVCN